MPASFPADSDLTLRWRLPAGQHVRFEDFDDGILMFDALVGSTHLLSATSAETLAVVIEAPGLTAPELHRRLLDRLALDERTLPFSSLHELLWQLENLNLLAADAA